MSPCALREWLRGDERTGAMFSQTWGDPAMMYQFVSVEEYLEACEEDEDLWGLAPIETAIHFKVPHQYILEAVQDGALDLCRIVHSNGLIQLVIPFISIWSFSWPYSVIKTPTKGRSNRKGGPGERLRNWELLLLKSDCQRGFWLSTWGYQRLPKLKDQKLLESKADVMP